jgi:hypothetical protein
MATGRCAGCGAVLRGTEKANRAHVLSCERWAELYRQDPARALEPEEEHARYQEQDRPAEREARLAALMADTAGRRRQSLDRFRRRDPLEDE